MGARILDLVFVRDRQPKRELKVRLIDWLNGWLVDLLADWLIDQLIDNKKSITFYFGSMFDQYFLYLLDDFIDNWIIESLNALLLG